MPTELQNGILFQGENMFVVRGGKRIANRNQQTKTWIPLEPGWQVFDAEGFYGDPCLPDGLGENTQPSDASPQGARPDGMAGLQSRRAHPRRKPRRSG
jgi:hypothetical protein